MKKIAVQSGNVSETVKKMFRKNADFSEISEKKPVNLSLWEKGIALFRRLCIFVLQGLCRDATQRESIKPLGERPGGFFVCSSFAG